MHNVSQEFVFLNNLRMSGATNMFGATPYLQEEFGLDRKEAKDILMEWMNWTSEDDDNVMIGVDESTHDEDDGDEYD